MNKIVLGKRKSFKSVNEENKLNVNLTAEEMLLPYENYTTKIDSYQKYFNEKDASDKYRLIFTINPVCSNILFNTNTEIIYKEGGNDCQVISSGGTTIGDADINAYLDYKGCGTSLKQEDAIRDTAFSHSKIGNLIYHCGVDIFNNHLLRKRNFSVVNKIAEDNTNKEFFNTIRDYLRDRNGKTVKEKLLKYSGYAINNDEEEIHLYQHDDIRTFFETITEELVESDGWVGFINPVTMNIENYVTGDTSLSINKCMNNNKGGEMIDMYPDRSLYSFIPKYNKYRNRVEKNWDYCITYPFETYKNELVEGGLECKIITVVPANDITNGKTYVNILLRTKLRNTFKVGDYVNFTFNDSYATENPVRIESIGNNNEDSEHYFSINLDSIVSDIGTTKLQSVKARVRKNVNGKDCEYYFRRYKRLPNFNKSDVYADDVITDEEIDKYSQVDFNSSLNKLAFSENIFSDKIAQIIFNDDIVTTGLRDNLNRPLTELYLTIVKRNAGNELWYNQHLYGDEKIEFSHCFSNITSGLDLPSDYYEKVYEDENGKYNIHMINGIDTFSPLEDKITISGDNDNSFLGDIVEFSPYTLEETVIEKVYHRFNTMQREIDSSDYGTVVYDDFKNDDYDAKGFTICGTTMYERTNLNINKEGYYYNPNYKISIRQLSEFVQQGEDIRINFTDNGFPYLISTNIYGCITAVPYYFNNGDTIVIYNNKNGTIVNGTIESVEGKINTEIKFSAVGIGNIKDCTFFKINPLKPDNAYELNDGTGRYIWREILPSAEIMYGDELYDSMFTNGAHYFHTNINFYLRRQDPFGEYGINGNKGEKTTMDTITGAANGVFKDVSIAEYKEENSNNIC